MQNIIEETMYMYLNLGSYESQSFVSLEGKENSKPCSVPKYCHFTPSVIAKLC